MKKTGLAFTLLLVAVVIAVTCYYSMGRNAYRRATQDALDTFSNVVTSQQVGKLGGAFKSYIANNAKIHLDVSFATLENLQGNPPLAQDFDKSSFYTFIDNVLYSLQDYHVNFKVQDFKLNEPEKSASLTFTSNAAAESELSYGEVHTNTHFMANSECTASVSFDENIHPNFDNFRCKVKITSMPHLAQSKQ